MTKLQLPADPKYHLMTDLANQAIKWIGFPKALTPNKPFFTYFAPGATHAPHHVPKEWIAKYKGKFDQGWDKRREETLARQIKRGVVPVGTKLAPKPESIKAEGRIEHTQAMIFSADEGADIGFDGETPVSDDYKEGNNKFTGKIHKVTIDIGELKLGAAEHHELHKATVARKAAE